MIIKYLFNNIYNTYLHYLPRKNKNKNKNKIY